jgi:hypothetical protein
MFIVEESRRRLLAVGKALPDEGREEDGQNDSAF